jgi:hypothetical protein
MLPAFHAGRVNRPRSGIADQRDFVHRIPLWSGPVPVVISEPLDTVLDCLEECVSSSHVDVRMAFAVSDGYADDVHGDH